MPLLDREAVRQRLTDAERSLVGRLDSAEREVDRAGGVDHMLFLKNIYVAIADHCWLPSR